MAKLLEKKGITAGKVFLEAKEAEEGAGLWIWTPKHPDGHVEWSYHAAIIVNIETDEGKKPYVIDPSLFSAPVPVREWKEIQTKHSVAKTDLFFTKRFNYDDENWRSKLDDYEKKDIINMEKTLREDLERQRFREQIKSGNFL